MTTRREFPFFFLLKYTSLFVESVLNSPRIRASEKWKKTKQLRLNFPPCPTTMQESKTWKQESRGAQIFQIEKKKEKKSDLIKPSAERRWGETRAWRSSLSSLYQQRVGQIPGKLSGKRLCLSASDLINGRGKSEQKTSVDSHQAMVFCPTQGNIVVCVQAWGPTLLYLPHINYTAKTQF